MSSGRFAFVNLQVGAMTGVAKSIAGQVAAAERLQLPIDYFVVGTEGAHGPKGVKSRAIESPLLRRVGAFFKARALATLHELDGYDAVFLRYPGGVDLDPLAFLRRCSRPVVTVHHTKEISELVSGGRSAANLGRAALEWLNGARIIRRVAGVVGVTDEIRDYELNRASRRLPARTIANGIDVGAVKQTGRVPFVGGVLRLLFIAGSHAPWHGTDRLLASLAAYRGPIDLHLDMVGATTHRPGTRERHANATIEYHGTLTGPPLDECFGRASLAISSLAMFRNGLEQGCVLKTREYVARGLPLVIGYDDVDLRGDQPWVLRVPNDESLVDFHRVIDFADRVSRAKAISDEMREFARNQLDWTEKVRAFAAFGQEIASLQR